MQRDQLITWVRDRDAEGHTVYICPYLHQGRNRRLGTSVERRWLHADVDRAFDPELADDLGAMVVRSGTPGRAHVYVRLANAVTVGRHRQLCELLRGALRGDDKVRDNDLLRPPETHNRKHANTPRQVVLVRRSDRAWAPNDLAHVLRTKGEINGAPAGAERGHTHHTRGRATCVQPLHHAEVDLSRLPTRIRELLGLGSVAEDRSPDRLSLAMSFQQHGYTLQEFESTVLDPRAPASRMYRLDAERHQRPLMAQRRIVAVDWAKTGEYVEARPAIKSRGDARQRVEELRAQATRHAWGPSPGASDRVVLAGIHTLALRLGRVDIDVSVREISDTSGVAKTTAGKALGRLQRSGWIRLYERGSRAEGLAARYQLTLPVQHSVATPPVPVTSAHDYWRTVREVAHYVYDAVRAGFATPPEIEGVTGIGQRTVRTHLRQLGADGLLGREGQRWSLRGQSLDVVVKEVGLSARGTERAAQHQRERQAHARQFPRR